VLALSNLILWSLQITAVGLGGTLLVRLLRLCHPQALHAYFCIVLSVCLLLPVMQPWRTRVAGAIDPAATFDLAVRLPVHAGEDGLDYPAVVFAILGTGAILRLGWMVAGLARLRRYRLRSLPVTRPAELAACLEEAEPSVEVRISGELSGPTTFGVLRPVVLVPGWFPRMQAEWRRAVLLHELIHARRRDWLFALIEEMIRAVFWFHPVIWLLVERIRLAREQVVDHLVVSHTRARKAYIEALLAVAAPGVTPLEPAPAWLRKRHLLERVGLLVKETHMTRMQLVLILAALAGAMTALTGTIVNALPLEKEAQAAVSASGRPLALQEEPAVKAGGDVSPPTLVYKTEPQYTEEAREAGIEGTVILLIEIGRDGAVEQVTVKKSLDSGLDLNAAQAVRQWKFEPGRKAGKPVRVRATVEVNFRLD